MLTGRATGKSRRLGFLKMTNDTKVARVFAALTGRDVNGRALNMHEACPKTDRSGPRDGGEIHSRDDYRESAR